MDIRHKAGVVTELLAAKFFAEQDYEIYWPIQPGSRCDFVICKNGKFQKVQVKKATWSRAGNHKYLQARLGTRTKHNVPKYTSEDFDLIVFIDEMGAVWVTEFKNIDGMTSVCLASTNPNYRQYTKYNANEWRKI